MPKQLLLGGLRPIFDPILAPKRLEIGSFWLKKRGKKRVKKTLFKNDPRPFGMLKQASLHYFRSVLPLFGMEHAAKDLGNRP